MSLYVPIKRPAQDTWALSRFYKKKQKVTNSLLYCEIKKPLLYSCPTSRIYKIMGLLACFLRRRSSRLSRNAIFRHLGGGGGGGGRGKSRWRRRLGAARIPHKRTLCVSYQNETNNANRRQQEIVKFFTNHYYQLYPLRKTVRSTLFKVSKNAEDYWTNLH